MCYYLRYGFLGVIYFTGILASAPVSALSIADFHHWCNQTPSVQCHDLVPVQAYVGGALDAIGLLQAEQQFVKPLFCKKPQDLFQLPAIIDFMNANAKPDDKRNAIVLVVEYLAVNGGCVVSSSKNPIQKKEKNNE
jgi:hypothetical protein